MLTDSASTPQAGAPFIAARRLSHARPPWPAGVPCLSAAGEHVAAITAAELVAEWFEPRPCAAELRPECEAAEPDLAGIWWQRHAAFGADGRRLGMFEAGRFCGADGQAATDRRPTR